MLPSVHQAYLRVSSLIAYPFQRAVDMPAGFFDWLSLSVTEQHKLMLENEQLRVQEVLLAGRLQKLMMLEEENKELRALLQSTPHASTRITIARLLAVSQNPNLQEVVLNQGEDQNITVGQPVFDAYGVMGQVVGVGPLTSRVLLITDPRSAVPVLNNRNGIRAIVVGSGVSGQLHLINMPAASDVKVGDVFVTSGLGLRFPSGYPVAVVTAVKSADNGLSSNITLMPVAHIMQSEQVLLSWPDKKAAAVALKNELQTTLTAINGTGAV